MILVSACLLGENCRYDGRNCRNEELITLLQDKEVRAVCPELCGGLSIPRPPAEIVGGDGRKVLEGKAIVQDKLGKDVTREFVAGGESILSGLKDEEIELAILKSRSPSCGSKYIYDGTFSGRLREGPGVFGALLLEKGTLVYSEEDLDIIKELLL